MEGMIKEYAGSIIRTLLLPLFAMFSERGYITDSDATNMAMAVAAFAVAVGWGLWNKYGWKKTTVDALNTTPPATAKKLEEVIEGN